MIGGVAGAGIAVGPILGGWATTELTWRIVFAGEVVLVAFILVMTPKVADAAAPRAQPAARRGGLGAVGGRSRGLRLRVSSQSSTWGWLKPKNSPITIFGFSLTIYVIACGRRC